MAPAGSVRVVSVGALDYMTRGRPSEFRHRGLSFATRPTVASALIEISRDTSCVVLVPSDFSEMPVLHFIDVIRSLTPATVIVGVTHGSEPSIVEDSALHGASGSVLLPVTPGRLARVIDSLRSSAIQTISPLKLGALELNPACHKVVWEDVDVHLAPKEFEMVQYLMAAHPRLVPLQELAAKFNRGDKDCVAHMRVAVGKIRLKFAAVNSRGATPFSTVPRIGYRLNV